MEEIDQHLRDEQIPIPARELRALSELAKRLQMSFLVSPLPDYDPAGYSDLDLVIRAKRWVRDRYGSRLAMEMRPGRVVLLLRDDPWELWIPLFYGSHRFFADPNVPSDPIENPVNPARPIPRFNVLDAITHLTPAMRKSLSKEECQEILRVFRVALVDLGIIRDAARRHPLLRQALADLDTSSHLILGPTISFGQAKWATLQHAEKSIKAFIAAAGGEPPRTHDLAALVRLAEEYGAGPVPDPWLQRVQCPAGVRYGKPAVTLEEVIAAQHASLDIAAQVTSDLSLYGL